MGRTLNVLVIAGALLALAGLIGLAMPVFTTPETTEVARIGDLHVDAKQNKTHAIPPLVSGGALALGIVLMGGGLLRRS
jgi:hypothetical protein